MHNQNIYGAPYQNIGCGRMSQQHQHHQILAACSVFQTHRHLILKPNASITLSLALNRGAACGTKVKATMFKSIRMECRVTLASVSRPQEGRAATTSWQWSTYTTLRRPQESLQRIPEKDGLVPSLVHPWHQLKVPRPMIYCNRTNGMTI